MLDWQCAQANRALCAAQANSYSVDGDDAVLRWHRTMLQAHDRLKWLPGTKSLRNKMKVCMVGMVDKILGVTNASFVPQKGQEPHR
jgi:hypothetical protein